MDVTPMGPGGWVSWAEMRTTTEVATTATIKMKARHRRVAMMVKKLLIEDSLFWSDSIICIGIETV